VRACRFLFEQLLMGAVCRVVPAHERTDAVEALSPPVPMGTKIAEITGDQDPPHVFRSRGRTPVRIASGARSNGSRTRPCVLDESNRFHRADDPREKAQRKATYASVRSR
jgi:hypothetical protein